MAEWIAREHLLRVQEWRSRIQVRHAANADNDRYRGVAQVPSQETTFDPRRRQTHRVTIRNAPPMAITSSRRAIGRSFPPIAFTSRARNS